MNASASPSPIPFFDVLHPCPRSVPNAPSWLPRRPGAGSRNRAFVVAAALLAACTPTSRSTSPVEASAASPHGDSPPDGASNGLSPSPDPPGPLPDAGALRPADPPLNDGGPDGFAAPSNRPALESDGMLLVPEGPFVMGADRGGEPDERPAHTVTLPAYYLDRTEVTHEMYDACVQAGACRDKDRRIASRNHAGPDENFQKPRQPVTGVSWSDAKAYCAYRGKRLPSEAEFEKAMRGTDGRRFAWGNDPPSPDKAVFGRAYGRDSTDEVGLHPHGRGPYGHDDLAGNVWEWVEDEYDPVAYTRPTAPSGKPGTCNQILASLAELRSKGAQGFTGSNPIPQECEHVLRGGAFNYDGPGLRATNRVHHPGRFRLVMSGFRCAKDAPPSPTPVRDP